METSGRPIKKLIGIFRTDRESRSVEIKDVHEGMAFVQPTYFDPQIDPAVYYHGWGTPVEYIRDVTVIYEDGDTVYLGDPPAGRPIVIKLDAKVRTEVL